jgi:hypothetical protein
MNRFSWELWERHARHFDAHSIWAFERWFLMYLHDSVSLDAIAYLIHQNLMMHGYPASVAIESIWVDGTPQAEARHASGEVKCELADLLLLVREEDSTGQLLDETALLIQGKVANAPNKLPGGKSTKKERLLLENTDRYQPIKVLSGTADSSSLIGKYTLGLSADGKQYGLEDCAIYLLFPKLPSKHEKRLPLLRDKWRGDPFQLGWPRSRFSTIIVPPLPFVETVCQMTSGNPYRIGRKLIQGNAANACAWTSLVNDLLKTYQGVQMNGYQNQARINTSNLNVSCFAQLTVNPPLITQYSSRNFLSTLRQLGRSHGDDIKPPINEPRRRDEGPAIPTVKITVRQLDTAYS